MSCNHIVVLGQTVQAYLCCNRLFDEPLKRAGHPLLFLHNPRRFKPVEPHFADSHFLGSQLGFRSAGNTRLSNALADHETNEASAKLSKYQQNSLDSFAAQKHSSLQCVSRS